jgi:hypothetical protein
MHARVQGNDILKIYNSFFIEKEDTEFGVSNARKIHHTTRSKLATSPSDVHTESELLEAGGKGLV